MLPKGYKHSDAIKKIMSDLKKGKMSNVKGKHWKLS
jgi:hypothetical protein